MMGSLVLSLIVFLFVQIGFSETIMPSDSLISVIGMQEAQINSNQNEFYVLTKAGQFKIYDLSDLSLKKEYELNGGGVDLSVSPTGSFVMILDCVNGQCVQSRYEPLEGRLTSVVTMNNAEGVEYYQADSSIIYRSSYNYITYHDTISDTVGNQYQYRSTSMGPYRDYQVSHQKWSTVNGSSNWYGRYFENNFTLKHTFQAPTESQYKPCEITKLSEDVNWVSYCDILISLQDTLNKIVLPRDIIELSSEAAFTSNAIYNLEGQEFYQFNDSLSFVSQITADKQFLGYDVLNSKLYLFELNSPATQINYLRSNILVKGGQYNFSSKFIGNVSSYSVETTTDSMNTWVSNSGSDSMSVVVSIPNNLDSTIGFRVISNSEDTLISQSYYQLVDPSKIDIVDSLLPQTLSGNKKYSLSLESNASIDSVDVFFQLGSTGDLEKILSDVNSTSLRISLPNKTSDSIRIIVRPRDLNHVADTTLWLAIEAIDEYYEGVNLGVTYTDYFFSKRLNQIVLVGDQTIYLLDTDSYLVKDSIDFSANLNTRYFADIDPTGKYLFIRTSKTNRSGYSYRYHTRVNLVTGEIQDFYQNYTYQKYTVIDSAHVIEYDTTGYIDIHFVEVDEASENATLVTDENFSYSWSKASFTYDNNSKQLVRFLSHSDSLRVTQFQFKNGGLLEINDKVYQDELANLCESPIYNFNDKSYFCNKSYQQINALSIEELSLENAKFVYGDYYFTSNHLIHLGTGDTIQSDMNIDVVTFDPVGEVVYWKDSQDSKFRSLQLSNGFIYLPFSNSFEFTKVVKDSSYQIDLSQFAKELMLEDSTLSYSLVQPIDSADFNNDTLTLYKRLIDGNKDFIQVKVQNALAHEDTLNIYVNKEAFNYLPEKLYSIDTIVLSQWQQIDTINIQGLYVDPENTELRFNLFGVLGDFSYSIEGDTSLIIGMTSITAFTGRVLLNVTDEDNKTFTDTIFVNQTFDREPVVQLQESFLEIDSNTYTYELNLSEYFEHPSADITYILDDPSTRVDSLVDGVIYLSRKDRFARTHFFNIEYFTNEDPQIIETSSFEVRWKYFESGIYFPQGDTITIELTEDEIQKDTIILSPYVNDSILLAAQFQFSNKTNYSYSDFDIKDDSLFVEFSENVNGNISIQLEAQNQLGVVKDFYVRYEISSVNDEPINISGVDTFNITLDGISPYIKLDEIFDDIESSQLAYEVIEKSDGIRYTLNPSSIAVNNQELMNSIEYLIIEATDGDGAQVLDTIFVKIADLGSAANLISTDSFKIRQSESVLLIDLDTVISQAGGYDIEFEANCEFLSIYCAVEENRFLRVIKTGSSKAKIYEINLDVTTLETDQLAEIPLFVDVRIDQPESIFARTGSTDLVEWSYGQMTFKNQGLHQVQIFNALGSMKFNSQSSEGAIDLNNSLESGSYIYTIKHKGVVERGGLQIHP